MLFDMGYEAAEAKFLKRLGQRIRSIREEQAWSQEKLSFECHLHRTYISSVERGERNIAVINLRKIAAALDISLAQLLDGLDSPENER